MLKKLYKDFFEVRDGENVSDKVFTARIFSSCAIVIICLLAMGISAYAYFSSSQATASNKLTSANYDIDISYEDNGSYTELADSTYVVSGAKTSLKLKFDATGSATTGYCKIVVSDSLGNVRSTVFTSQIETKKTPDEIIYLEIAGLEDGNVIQFIPCWGTSVASTEGKAVGSVVADGEPLPVVNVSSSN